ncbi:ribulokinase [Micromonospora maris]|uniref:Ribulokinase n=1 Tax=Micromonospora maris TaxID=1003110 RepID=A0A9X0LBW6_9ACTN|nr:ribulokinase [Micromonospora maris]AEB45010.1 ribulokinase [Micromonospora maris AB-18-032]KUJ44454.1 ribulokinase [Micromonospora maris]
MSGVGEVGDRYVVGVDYGTLSGRALVVRVRDGAELGTAVHEYRNAVIESALPDGGPSLPPDWALQDPQDYRDVLRHAVPAAVAAAGVDPRDVVGIGIDFTACTILPTLADGTPLCEVPELRQRPHAWVKLWKHHAAQPHADRINALAHERGEPWIGRYGGKISAEWQFAKGLQLLEEDPEVYRRADRFIEAADWIVWQLCGIETRNVCTAGYKGIMQDGKYPSTDYLTALNPDFGDFVTKLDGPLMPLADKAGELTAAAAAWTGLPQGIAVAVGNVDAHVTAASAQALAPGRLVAIMGTSTCHVVNGAQPAEVAGMCGVVEGGISAGAWGYEAGQSGVGDIFGWFVKHAAPAEVASHERLTELAAAQPVGAHGLVALDWWNGNRSLLVNHDLSGMIVGLTLATRPEDVYRALLEATAYGTRMIIEAFVEAGVPVNDLVIAGGLTSNTLLMQIYADVTNRPLSIIGSAQGPALGSAIHAAVAAGEYSSIHEASQAMGRISEAVYRPDPDRVRAYDALYAEYRTLHDHFGRGTNDVMLRLRAIRNAAAGSAASTNETASEEVA